MSPSPDRVSAFISGNTEPEEKLEDKVIWKVPLGLADHLKRNHFVNCVGSQLLKAATIFLEDLLLEIR